MFWCLGGGKGWFMVSSVKLSESRIVADYADFAD